MDGINSVTSRFLLKAARIPKRVLERLENIEKQRQCSVGRDVLFYPPSRVGNDTGVRSAITIGDHCRILGELRALLHGGNIKIGASCFIGEHSRIWSASSVRIGARVLISHNVNIHDNDSHSLSAEKRHQHFCAIFSTGHPRHIDDLATAPIVIEDDVWIGFNSAVFKGVTIGKGAVIGAGTIVTKDVEPYTVVVGNPPRVVGNSRP